ncbi:DUF6585 family protein [Pseudanabaena sp. 'Roaring Creek']|uniref:DUF6585 family protein n=1 Tax=Pseudanabaena sp. 'Roaring Creek' TaxID=1681830 RepID=UPI0006D85D96|nr:DUF6585 family protein [Pseudanabaena sp. 'Roaring Creek']
MIYQSNWIPHEGIVTHAGGQIPSNMDFFAPPPIEIGSILSAESNLTHSKQPIPISTRISLSLIAGGLLAYGIRYISKTDEVNIIAIAIGAIVGLILYLITEFRYSCSYVGEQGIVRLFIKGSRTAIPKKQQLCFKDASNLYVTQIRNYVNGIYAGTAYTYRWKQISGKDYCLNGQYHAEKKVPKDGDKWHFANTAERVWSIYLLESVNEKLNSLGYVEFPMTGNPKAVRIGRGFMEFVTKDKEPQRVAVTEMKDITLGGGVFQFKHQDAKWWSGKGKYSFTYSNIPNARLFLIVLESLTGIRWQ